MIESFNNNIYFAVEMEDVELFMAEKKPIEVMAILCMIKQQPVRNI